MFSKNINIPNRLLNIGKYNNYKLVNYMHDVMLYALDLAIRQINGEIINEKEFEKLRLYSREELLNIYQAFKKAILLLEDIII
ncbi:MAG: hypothetical protein ACP6IY_07175 [Promethearchaeia archaeon]